MCTNKEEMLLDVAATGDSFLREHIKPQMTSKSKAEEPRNRKIFTMKKLKSENSDFFL